MNEKILIFGNGQIGNLYLNYFTRKKLTSKISEADIANSSRVARAITLYKPTVVINTAAKTNLEWCEKNRLEAFKINVLGAENVAKACDENNAYLIHFSSGCIFQSKGAQDIKTEDASPNPAAYYAWTKVWSENMVSFNRSTKFRSIILRPRQPISADVNYKNMLVKLLTFSKYIDTPNTLTVLEDLMEWTFTIINKRPVGVLHVANEGWTTPYEIAKLLKKHILPKLNPIKISKKELDRITPSRRVDTRLSVNKLKKLGVKVPGINKRLEQIVIELAKNLKADSKKHLTEEIKRTVEMSKTRTRLNNVWPGLLK